MLKQLCHYAFISVAKLGLTMEEVEELLNDTEQLCTLSGIRGVLMYDGRGFFQIMEGRQDVINRRLPEILSNPHHTEIVPVLDQTVDIPVFDKWETVINGAFLDPQMQEHLLQFVNVEVREEAFSDKQQKTLQAHSKVKAPIPAD